MYTPVYYNFVVVPPVIAKPRTCMCVYIYIYILYCSIRARRPFAYLMWKPQLVVSVTYHPRFRQTKCCALSFPDIWWRCVKLQCMSVTEPDNATVYT
jgi:hypothetical protein